MKELKLTTWERVQLLQCVPTQGSISDIRKHLRLVEKLEMTDEEKALVSWKETRIMTPTGPGTTTVWGENMAGHVFEINLEDADFEHIKRLMGQHKGWPVNPLTVALYDKIEEVK